MAVTRVGGECPHTLSGRHRNVRGRRNRALRPGVEGGECDFREATSL